MVFSSLIFLYAFLPITLMLYAVGKKTNLRNYILLIASLVFYTWGEPVYVLILVAMTFIDWLSALLIQNVCEKVRTKKLVLIITIAINLLIIGFFKYTGFFLSNVNAIFGVPETIPNIILPIGISFYTFQLISYVVDVYREEVPAQKKFSNLLLYSSLFYQCIAGPIVRYSDVQNEIENRRINFTEVCEGISRFSIGLGKKCLLANICGSLSDQLLVSDIFMNSPETVTAALSEVASRSAVGVFFGVLFYMLQIYLDFSAYSDMAIGMGLMVGFHFKENFNYPYIANSVTDFWRRWHISLSRWLRDYVYIPLGGNRKGKVRRFVNLMLTFLVSGIWHGSGMQYLFWGAMQGGYQIAAELLMPVRKKVRALFKLEEDMPLLILWQRVCTFALITISWVIFRSASLRSGLSMLKRIFTDITPWVFFDGSLFTCGITKHSFIALLLMIVLVAIIEHRQEKDNLRETLEKQHGIVRWCIYLSAIALIAVLGVYGPGYDATQFLYGQF